MTTLDQSKPADEARDSRTSERVVTRPAPTRCELRPGIGLCDECSQPKWPQEYVGYGCMVCLDCLNAQRPNDQALPQGGAKETHE